MGDPQGHLRVRMAVVIFTALAAVMIGVMSLQLKKDYPGPGPFRGGQIALPVLAMELAGSKADLEEVLHTGKPEQKQASDALEMNTKLDCFFIVCYTGALVSLALLFTAGPEGRKLRWIAVMAAVLAGLFDYAENSGIFHAIKEQSRGAERLTDDLARHISYPSLEKWTTLGITLLILAVAVWSSKLAERRGSVDWILGLAFLIGGLLLLLAIQHLPLFPIANIWFGGALVAAAVRAGWTLIRRHDGAH